ncbi:MAG: zinc ribbon domain-containing protein [Acidiferrobacterales bacterium]|nr:zinc ribbon domain-containing protein [Acidiferrobacterales bacterium]
MHVITRCHLCSRQFDTEGHAPGERFHCLCGTLLTVPNAKSFDASVVRCSSCGGTREKQDRACGHCGADFTLHEQQLNTVCPTCLARISNDAKYCHHCATPITISGRLGNATEKSCPKCSSDQKLGSRTIKDTDMNALECNVCGGVWLEQAVFMELERRMIELASSGMSAEHVGLSKAVPNQKFDDQNFYRKCPICEKLMHRRNYGPGSGIVIDQCHQHGFWFDQAELDVILRWIRTGGLMASRKTRAAIQRNNDRLERILKKMDQTRDQWQPKPLWKEEF